MIDLQLHTTDSDGTWPWNKVLDHCLEMGLKAFAITDHDTLIRYEEIVAWSKKNGGKAIPGIELSAKDQDQTVHLLGYFLEGPLDDLRKKLEELQVGRRERNHQILEKLKYLGYPISEEELRIAGGEGSVGRPHIARLLMEKGVVHSIREAFDRFLALGGAAYVPFLKLDLQEGIELLHNAGAVTSIAHPILLNRKYDDLEDSIRQWKSLGLDALEVVYPAYNEEQMAFLKRMAAKYDLLMTGGSDFHGDNKPHIKIGTGTGSLQVPDDLLAPLLKRRDEILKAIA